VDSWPAYKNLKLF